MVGSNVLDELRTSQHLPPDILSRSVPQSFVVGGAEMLKPRLRPRSRCIKGPSNRYSWTRCIIWGEQWNARSSPPPLSCHRTRQNLGIPEPIQLRYATPTSGRVDVHVCVELTLNQVHLKRLNATDEQSSTEVVNARFVVGADG